MGIVKPLSKSTFPIVLGITGFTGILGQVLILRELLINFFGNELTIGIIISSWLLFEALGALFSGRFISFGRQKILIFSIITVFYGYSIIFLVYLSRGISTRVFDLMYGQMPGVEVVFIAAVIVTAPVSFLHGSLFPLACHNHTHTQREDTRDSSIGKMYVYEMIGTLVGGLLFSLYLVIRYETILLAFFAAALNLSAAVFILLVYMHSRKFLVIGIISLPFIVLLLFLPPGRLHDHSISYKWFSRNVVHYENTDYSNIVVLHEKGEYTFYSDGRPFATTPAPDTEKIADFINITLLAHQDPKNILVIGNGPAGLIAEVLKHPVLEVTYVEIDPRIPDIFLKFSTKQIIDELTDERVSLEKIDGRRFVSVTDKKFDVILIGFVEPDSLQTNRLHTTEFFSDIRSRLNPNGLFAYALPGSRVYMGEELENLNKCSYITLSSAFEHAILIPGDSNIFIGAMQNLKISSILLHDRMLKRNIPKSFINYAYLEYRLGDQAGFSTSDIVENNEDIKLNKDFHPTAFYYYLTYQNRMFSSQTFDFIKKIATSTLFTILFIIVILASLVLFIKKILTSGICFALSFSIMSTGVASMAFDLLIILVFQSVYGHAARMTGLLLGIFLTGMCLGGFQASKRSNQEKNLNVFKFLELAITGLLICVYFFSHGIRLLFPVAPGWIIIMIISLFLSFSGFCAGYQFPLAAKALKKYGKKTGSTAGGLYASDLLGGFAGGIMISVVLFPLAGLFTTVIILAVLKTAGYLNLLIKSKGA